MTPAQIAYAARLRALFWIVGAAWVLFTVQFAARPVWPIAAVDGAAALLTLGVRLWAIRDERPERLRWGTHGLIAVSAVGIVTASMLAGQGSAPATWLLVCCPLVAGYQDGGRAAVVWAVVAGALITAVHVSPRVMAIDPAFVAGGFQVWMTKLTLLVVFVAFTVASARASAGHVAALEERERVIAAQADDLRAARDEALAAARAKSDFLANMSHEIRTPLNGVIGMADVLRETPLTKEQRELVRTIGRSGTSVLSVINDILDFSRLEAEGIELESAPFDLHECAEDAVAMLGQEAWSKGIDLACVIDRNVPQRVVGDVTRLRQVLVNLIGNAVKFTDRGYVRADVEPADGARIRFTVADTGIGIPEDLRDRLFRPFSQGDTSTARRFGGSGLGLVICRRFVELMGGTIRVDSAPGRGSSFSFEIPCPRAPEQADTGEPAVAIAGRQVLVVDEHPATTSAAQRALHGWGVDMIAATDARAAAAALRENPGVDVALLCAALPDLADVAAAVRAHRADLYTVLMTAPGERENRARTGELGISDVVYKPLRRGRLRSVVESAVTGYKPETREIMPALDSSMAERVPLTILLAEDNPVNQRVAVAILEGLGYAPAVVSNGSEVMSAVAQVAYDVVLMDMQMPEIDGLQATRRIRAELPPGAQPRIIALTANVLDAQRRECAEAGMDDFLGKPIQVPDLIAALERARAGARSNIWRSSITPEEALAQMREIFSDDPDEYCQIIESHIAQADQLVAAMRGALDARDATALGRAAHSLKGSSASFGAARVSELGSELEQTARAGDLSTADAMLATLQVEVEASRERLREEIDRLRGGGGAAT